jgi:H+-translocating NAD(P) transhydrogenase subunit beta
VKLAVDLAYLVAIVLFILSIKRLGRVRTARGANGLAAIGMLIAIVGALVDPALLGKLDYRWIVGGGLVGAAIGVFAARTVAMTSMPEMVALLNGSGGFASLLVGLAFLFETKANHWDKMDGATLVAALTANPAVGAGEIVSLTLGLSILIGGVTATGSLVAYGKLSGKVSGNAIVFGGQQPLNALLGLVTIGVMAWLCYVATSPALGVGLALGLTALALALGILLVIPIGGADMPVVISLLNSYSGIAAAMTGFVLNNNLLIVTGALVGASGIILTKIMCDAMNRSLASVLLGGFGATQAAAQGKTEYKNVKSLSAEDLAMLLDGVSSVVFVPGYGLAVAQAQHVVRELGEVLEARGATVKYAIHPVAGRMPGHMNVLLAEASVPYESMVEMDQINPEFKTTDLVIVLGANDVVNPAALTDPQSPLAGMPILMVHEARNVVVVKRSLGAGYAGIKNTLFEYDNCRMLFDDAKAALQATLTELKQTA